MLRLELCAKRRVLSSEIDSNKDTCIRQGLSLDVCECLIVMRQAAALVFKPSAKEDARRTQT